MYSGTSLKKSKDHRNISFINSVNSSRFSSERKLKVSKGRVKKLTFRALALRHRSDEGLTLETSAFLPFTVANLRFQPSC